MVKFIADIIDSGLKALWEGIHGRGFNFIVLPILVGILYAQTTGVADLQLRMLIIAQMFFINLFAFLLAKALTANLKTEDVCVEARGGNMASAVIYLAAMLVRIGVYFTMVYGYTQLLGSKAG